MKYLFFLPHAGYDSPTGHIKTREALRLVRMAKRLRESYAPENTIVTAYPASWMKQSANVVSRVLQCPVSYSLTMQMSYAGDRAANARNVLSQILHKMEESSAESAVVLSKCTDLHYVAFAAVRQFLPEKPVAANSALFKPGSLMVIDIDNRTVEFFQKY